MKVSSIIGNLINNGNLSVTHYFDNGTYAKFELTEKGEKELKHNYNKTQMIDWLNTIENTTILIELINNKKETTAGNIG
ncbi:hypothetical protein Q0590_37095 [Rhodocytophaga aerolata]|uniref:Uncharacterized protein n=1 Tax=Rhodocytophaga aerolata TaxID=455078 RepID=A0ABT8RL10_9BACT|nr:hypothetical protein [Rhodocytophaga aerolata]MDO1451945.1 hypothetical protein [Rhodocytophaga aerolata]